MILLAPMGVVAALTGRHPVEWLVDHTVRRGRRRTRPIPRAGAPRRFAYALAASWLVGAGAALMAGMAVLGSVLGLVGASVVLELIEGTGFIPYARLGVNPVVFGWGVLLTLVFGLISGVYPAWKMSRLHPAEALSGRTA